MQVSVVRFRPWAPSLPSAPDTRQFFKAGPSRLDGELLLQFSTLFDVERLACLRAQSKEMPT
jgi:hypothetical protein